MADLDNVTKRTLESIFGMGGCYVLGFRTVLDPPEAAVSPGFRGVKNPGFSRHGDDAVALELYRREPSELAVTAASVVPDLEVVELALASSTRVFHTSSGRAVSKRMRDQNETIIELSERSPTLPMEGMRPGLGPVGPGPELGALIGVDHCPNRCGLLEPVVDRHP